MSQGPSLVITVNIFIYKLYAKEEGEVTVAVG